MFSIFSQSYQNTSTLGFSVKSPVNYGFKAYLKRNKTYGALDPWIEYGEYLNI